MKKLVLRLGDRRTLTQKKNSNNKNKKAAKLHLHFEFIFVVTSIFSPKLLFCRPFLVFVFLAYELYFLISFAI
jgi:hypothetical protein